MQVKANRVYCATVFPKDDYYKFSFHYIVSVAGSGLENSSLTKQGHNRTITFYSIILF